MKNAIVVTAAIISVTLVGCSSPASTATPTAPPSSAAADTPSATPTPTTSSPTPSPSASASVFTKQQAAAYYLSVICPSNASIDAVSDAVFGKKKTVYFLEFSKAKRDKVRKKAKAAAAASRLAASQLDGPPSAWPPNVRKSMDKLVVEMLKSYEWYANLGAAKSNSTLLARWNTDLKSSGAAQLIRLRLGLPATGKGCPKT
jgi:hypothetical protein